MGVISKIVDGHGTSNQVKVDNEGAIGVVIHPHPPIDESLFPLPFTQYFTDNGTDTGSNDMIVNGGTNFVDFYISAQTDIDIYIKSITVQISDPGARLDRLSLIHI